MFSLRSDDSGAVKLAAAATAAIEDRIVSVDKDRASASTKIATRNSKGGGVVVVVVQQRRMRRWGVQVCPFPSDTTHSSSGARFLVIYAKSTPVRTGQKKSPSPFLKMEVPEWEIRLQSYPYRTWLLNNGAEPKPHNIQRRNTGAWISIMNTKSFPSTAGSRYNGSMLFLCAPRQLEIADRESRWGGKTWTAKLEEIKIVAFVPFILHPANGDRGFQWKSDMRTNASTTFSCDRRHFSVEIKRDRCGKGRSSSDTVISE